jgi:hypothetical protein
VKIFIFLLTTTTSSDETTATNLRSHGNNDNGGNGGEERRPREEGPGGSGRKNKGKGKMTEEHEWEERDRKALEQHREEVMGRVAAALAAENETVQNAQAAIANLTQVLSEMEDLDTAHPRFAQAIIPEPFDFHQSPTTSGPVGDEDDPVSEDLSERDPEAVYSEDEGRQGASQ